MMDCAESAIVPLPPVIHKTITGAEIQDKDWVFIIGDVHGCLDELQDLIRESQLDMARTVTIFCGDILRKGPKNLETLGFIRSLPNAHCVRGNHEVSVIRKRLLLKEGCSLSDPKDYWISDLTEEDLDYLIRLSYTIRLPSLAVLVVHAGLVPGIEIDKQDPVAMVKMRNVDEINNVLIAVEKGDRGVAWGATWRGPDHVFFGHDAVRGLQRHKYATGLDTRCVYGGSLTGMVLSTGNGERRVVTVPARQMYKETAAERALQQ